MSELVLRGGDVVTSSGVSRADIAVDGGTISGVGPDLPGGRREIDASGLTIFPGLVDVHVHFNEPGHADWEGAATGSRALAAGGGTVFIDMPLNSTPCTVAAADFERKRAALEAASITDFALWGGIVPGNLGSLGELAECGVAGYKAFMCDSGLPEFPRADDLTLFEGMREAARLGLPVAVHAESEEIVRGLTARLRGQGRNDIRAFLESRPIVAEVEAVARAGTLAREAGCRLHIVHISSGRGVAAALEARALGADITIETCPHYLFFTEEDLARIGALAKCAPPLRNAGEREALWSALLRDEVDVVGSDHSPCPPEMKRSADFFEIWGGIPGVQTTLAVLLDEGYRRRGLPLERIAALAATNGARRFGLARKGRIEPGRDADLALVDLNGATEINERTLLHRHRTSPYEGRALRGAVRATFLRGEPAFPDARTRGRLVRPESVRAAGRSATGPGASIQP